jgi:predicted dehydrogenase
VNLDVNLDLNPELNPETPEFSPQNESDSAAFTRRQLLGAAVPAGIGLAAVGALSSPVLAQNSSPATAPRQPPTPQVTPPLPPFVAATERQSPPPPPPLPPGQRVGYALVGLGRLTVEELLPAFGECKYSRPVALVSGDPQKAAQLAAQHGIPSQNLYSYANFDAIRNNPAIEAVYIVLPNSQHEEFTARAARAGKHVLTEKPMAANSAQARRMIEACRAANRKLMVAYRIQYETYNRAMRDLVRSNEFGRVKIIEAINGQNQGEANQWRHVLALAGGGSLPDIGLYCLNTIRFLLGEEPIEVMGTTYSTPGDPRFREVEENCLWQMRFPSGVQANCVTGYGHHMSRRYRVHMERAWANLEMAFAYRGQQMQVARAQGASERIENRQLDQVNQFAAEIDHFSDCIINNKIPFTPGEEGLQDHLLMEAIYRSAREKRAITLPPIPKRDAFRGPEPKTGGNQAA